MSIVVVTQPDDAAFGRSWQDAVAGGEQGFAWLVRHTQREVYQRCVWYLGEETLGQEATQETFLRLHQALKQGAFADGDPPSEPQLRGWLRRVATHVSIDLQRSATARLKKLWRLFSMQVTTPSVPSAVARLELDETFRALYRLNETQRAALVMSVFEGLTNAEIAEALERSEPAIEQLLVRARRRLRQLTRG